MTLVIYLVGWLILIGGVSWALIAMHVSQHTVTIVAVILLGIAVITAATRTRNRVAHGASCSSPAVKRSAQRPEIADRRSR